MTESGSEAGQSTAGKSRWTLASLSSLVLGFFVYVAGAVAFSWAEHGWLYSHTGDNLRLLANMQEWGTWAKDGGVALVILGLVFYVAGRRKGV